MLMGTSKFNHYDIGKQKLVTNLIDDFLLIYLVWEPSQNPSGFWVFPHSHLGLFDIVFIFYSVNVILKHFRMKID